MRKLASVVFILTLIIAMSSCSIDDSNDIEILKPGDTVIIGKLVSEKLR